MRYWYDTEFIEDGKTIDLISIGIVAADGREFYAESAEFDESKANLFVVQSVLPHLTQAPLDRPSRKEIAKQVFDFIQPGYNELWSYYGAYDHVALAQLWGTMIQMPKHIPMYTNELMQLRRGKDWPEREEVGNHHNSLADAYWHKQLFEAWKD